MSKNYETHFPPAQVIYHLLDGMRISATVSSWSPLGSLQRNDTNPRVSISQALERMQYVHINSNESSHIHDCPVPFRAPSALPEKL